MPVFNSCVLRDWHIYLIGLREVRSLNELKKRRTEIEQEFGDKLDWDFRRNTMQQQCRIEIYRTGSIQDDAATLEDIRSWIIEHLCKLRTVFGPKWPD